MWPGRLGVQLTGRVATEPASAKQYGFIAIDGSDKLVVTPRGESLIGEDEDASIRAAQDGVMTTSFARRGADDRQQVEGDRRCEQGELTEEGMAFWRASSSSVRWKAANETHRAALLRQPVTQALIQGLHGRGPVSFEGALHFLARHRLATLEDKTAVRALLGVLNAAGLVAWSNQRQTVRILVELPEASVEFEPIVRVIERDRPFSNAMHLRQIIRSCEGYLHWAEPHLPRKALESLVSEADGLRFKETRLWTRSWGCSRPTGSASRRR